MATTNFNEEELRDHHTVSLIINHKGRLLMSVNIRHDMLTFPIGKCHLDESPKEGLIREIKEELGLDIEFFGIAEQIREIDKFTTVYHREGKDVKVIQHLFVLDIKKDEQYLLDAIFNKEPEKCRCLIWLYPSEFSPFCKMNGIAGVADGVRRSFPGC